MLCVGCTEQAECCEGHQKTEKQPNKLSAVKTDSRPVKNTKYGKLVQCLPDWHTFTMVQDARSQFAVSLMHDC